MEIEKERIISLNLNWNVQCDYQPYAVNDTNRTELIMLGSVLHPVYMV